MADSRHELQDVVSRSSVEAGANPRSERDSERNEGQTTSTENEESRLPPVDRGIVAWRLLSAAFMLEALFWGKLITPLLIPNN